MQTAHKKQTARGRRYWRRGNVLYLVRPARGLRQAPVSENEPEAQRIRAVAKAFLEGRRAARGAR